jgi:peptidoglycan hydrolase-like protein with peptidoglycan-binding domain
MRGRALVAAVGWPQGWSAGAVRPGTGYARADGSRRVRELQRRLRRRGYRPGPVDGRFGPRTRSALIWFQLKHGLPRTGTVDVHTLAAVHSRRAPGSRPAAVARTVTGAAPTPGPDGRTTPDLTAIAVAVLAALLALVYVVTSSRRRVRDGADAGPEPRSALPPAAGRRPPEPPPAGPAEVLGYPTVPTSQVEVASASGAWCERPAGLLGRGGDGTLDARCRRAVVVVTANPWDTTRRPTVAVPDSPSRGGRG